MPALYRTVTYSATGNGASINLDPSIAPFQVAVACSIAVSATYKIQYSLDPMDITDANATWFDSTGIPPGTTTASVTTFVGPVSRVRPVIASLGSSGSVTVQTYQGISTN